VSTGRGTLHVFVYLNRAFMPAMTCVLQYTKRRCFALRCSSGGSGLGRLVVLCPVLLPNTGCETYGTASRPL